MDITEKLADALRVSLSQQMLTTGEVPASAAAALREYDAGRAVQCAPTPWKVTRRAMTDTYVRVSVHAGDRELLAVMGAMRPLDKNEADAERMVECVNACEGVQDPATAIAAVRELLHGNKRDGYELAQAAGVSK